jgi:small subunit ribosomal protein S9
MTTEKYFESTGRRKTSVARVRLFAASKQSIVINDKDLATYFPTKELARVATEAFETSKTSNKFKVTAVIKGGGISSQAQALRHAIARALTVSERDLRAPLKKAGFLKRDPRAKERRKFGLKKARKAPQWSKR